MTSQPRMGEGGQHLLQNYLIGCSSDSRLPLGEPIPERWEGVSRGKGRVTPRETCQAPWPLHRPAPFAGSQAHAGKMNMQAPLSCPDGGHRPSFCSLGTSPFLTWSEGDSGKGDTEVEGLVTDHLSLLRVPFLSASHPLFHRNDRKKHMKRAAYP